MFKALLEQNNSRTLLFHLREGFQKHGYVAMRFGVNKPRSIQGAIDFLAVISAEE